MRVKQISRLTVFSALFFLFSCSVNLPNDHYKKKMPRVERGYHIVKKGDTIYQIAWRYGWDYRELASANGLKRPFLIVPNQRIKLYLKASTKPAKRSFKPSRPRSKVAVTQRKERKKFKDESASERGSIRWRWPVKGPVLSGFENNNPLHQGLKIGIKNGSKVGAAAKGTVVYVGDGIRRLEKLIIVEHKNGFLSAYAHNQKIVKKEGEIVKAGEIIAETGSNERGKAMLHFEIRRKGNSVDPRKYLP